MYSILDVNSCEKSIYKGHNFSIRNDEFMDVLFNKKVIRHIIKGVKSLGHRMYILIKVINHLYLLLMIRDIFLMTEYIL